MNTGNSTRKRTRRATSSTTNASTSTATRSNRGVTNRRVSGWNVNRQVLLQSISPGLKPGSAALMAAEAIVNGNVYQFDAAVRASKGTTRGIPVSWYSKVFDRTGNKLVAFAGKALVASGMSADHMTIFKTILMGAKEKSHIMTCAKDRKGHCIPHAVAPYMKTAENVKKMANIVNGRMRELHKRNSKTAMKTFKQHGMVTNSARKTAHEYAQPNSLGSNSIRNEFMRGTADRTGKPLSAANRKKYRDALELFSRLGV
jgi:hypothetical protein